MADEDRAPPHALDALKNVEEAPHGYDFFQAVRLIDCAEHNKPPTGCSSRLADDIARFGQEVGMGFPPSTLSNCDPPKEGRARRLWQRFFGLLGPNGPLPMHLTEYELERRRDRGDRTFSSFLNVFHHRMTAFFYRSWARVRPTVSFDSPKNDRFSDYVGSLFGLGMPSLRDRDALPDLPKRHFAGLLACQTKHADGLLAILSGYFNFPVQIEEFVGQWIDIPEGSQCLTGASSSTLGVSTTVGAQVWDCQQKFRIIVGPLSLDEYKRMLPGGADHSGDGRRESLDAMVSAVRNYIGDELDWDLQLILKKEETPPVRFGENCQLGWVSWMSPEALEDDPDDLVLRAAERVTVEPMKPAHAG